MKVLVTNIPDTSKNVCSCCGTWIDHWIKHKKVKPVFCRGCKKKTKDLLGGHVWKVKDRSDRKWYIVPLCSSCNQTPDKEFYVEESDLVWVRACEK